MKKILDIERSKFGRDKMNKPPVTAAITQATTTSYNCHNSSNTNDDQ